MHEVAANSARCREMTVNKHAAYLAYAIASGLLLTLSWQPFSVFPLIFGAFVPLLFLEQKIRGNRDHSGLFFAYLSIALFIWNGCTTYWIWNATAFGAVTASCINVGMMSLPFLVYHRMQKRIPGREPARIWIFCWLAFEYWHLNWDLSWPWLTLGNVFSTAPYVVQWFEYTGHLGGSLWVLYMNVWLFRYFNEYRERSRMMNFSKAFNLLFFGLFAPAFLSFYISANYKEHRNPLHVLCVQPNVDPYHDKFEGMTPVEQTRKMLGIAEHAMDSSIELVVFPETALVGNLDEDRLDHNESIQLIRRFVETHPGIAVLTGADTYRIYPDVVSKSPTARRHENEYYDSYNTALLITASPQISIYHKSKLVPGVEKMPFPKLLTFLEPLAVNLGGTTGSLGHDGEPVVFSLNSHDKVAPVICYESVFGEYLTKYMNKGAGLICVITNDGWWGNTPGYRQHFDFARLRAVETRRYVARSANTGISGFIDAKGNVLSETAWWVDDAVKATVNLNYNTTTYMKYGDYIGQAALVLALVSIVLNWRKRELE